MQLSALNSCLKRPDLSASSQLFGEYRSLRFADPGYRLHLVTQGITPNYKAITIALQDVLQDAPCEIHQNK